MTTVWRFDRTFRIDQTQTGRRQHIAFVGDLDALTAKRLRASDPIAVEAGALYVLDLTALETLDASAVREIRRIETAVTQSGGEVEIHGVTREMQRLFELILKTDLLRQSPEPQSNRQRTPIALAAHPARQRMSG